MQKQLRIGLLLVAMLLVVETARLFIAARDHINIQILAVNRSQASEVLDVSHGVTRTGQSLAGSGETNPTTVSTSISTVDLQKVTASPTRPASTRTARPSPDPTATATPTVTLVPYRTVIPEDKPKPQATEAPTEANAGTPAESGPVQPTNPPPEATSPAPTSLPATPTGAPDALPTPAPAEPPTPAP